MSVIISKYATSASIIINRHTLFLIAMSLTIIATSRVGENALFPLNTNATTQQTKESAPITRYIVRHWQSSKSKVGFSEDPLLTTYPGLMLMIQYAKCDPTLIGFKCIQHLLLEAIKQPKNNSKNLKSIKYQCMESKIATLQTWEQ